MKSKLARNLRHNMTNAERKLWKLIRDRQLEGCKFRRQHPEPPYILDFACTERALVIELDGGQHCESARDAHRTAFLETRGWHVIRFWNNEIFENMEGVIQTIQQVLHNRPRRGEAAASLSRTAGEGWGEGESKGDLEEILTHPHPSALRAADLSRGAGEV